MTNEYSRSAFSYACTWIWHDQPAVQEISFTRPEPPDDEKARAALCKFAHQYGVDRNFKKENDVPRLGRVWDALQSIPRPEDENYDEAKQSVAELAERLEAAYGQNAWSAASKFLWIRFRSPIIIYDMKTWGWLKREGKLGSFRDWKSAYYGFCDVWRTEYQKREGEIRVACEGLLDVREYLPPVGVIGGKLVGIPDAELEAIVLSGWFRERVFDDYMLTVEANSQIGTDGAK